MNIFNIRDGGRDLMVRVTCCRCKKTELMTWTQAMPESKEGYIRHSLLFCPDCRKEFKLFLNPDLTQKEDGNDENT